MNEACNGKWGCVNRKLLGWAALAGTVILLYTAVRLSASCLTSRSQMHEVYAWVTFLIYWFVICPAALITSLYAAKLSGIVE